LTALCATLAIIAFLAIRNGRAWTWWWSRFWSRRLCRPYRSWSWRWPAATTLQDKGDACGDSDREGAKRNCAHGATLRNALTPAMMTIPALDLTFMKEEQRLAGYTTTTHRSS